MTDTCKVENRYYDSRLYNSTTSSIAASTDDNLLYPIVGDSNDWSVAINKAKIDLSSIPLTQSNIPLKTYELGLESGDLYSTAYVGQLNGTTNNFVWNCPQGSTIITKYQYTNSTLIAVGSVNVGSICAYVSQFLMDDFLNMYIAGSNVSSSVANTLFIVSPESQVLDTLTYTQIMHIYIDRGQNLYVSDEGLVPKVDIYSNNNGESTVNLTLLTTLTKNFAGNPLSNILFCVADNSIIVGYNTNTITMYNPEYAPIADSTLSVTQMQSTAQISGTAGTFVIVDLNESYDQLLGTNTNAYIAGPNTQITSGATLISPFVPSGYGYCIGNDNYTYVAPFPDSSYPQALLQVNTATPMKGIICGNKNYSVYGIDNTGYAFRCWNYNLPPSSGDAPQNIWCSCGGTWGNNIRAMDYQESTNLLFSVGTSNQLNVSSAAVAPQDVYAVGILASGSVGIVTNGVFYSNSNGVHETQVINTTNNSHSATAMIRIGSYYYVLSGNSSGEIYQYTAPAFTATGTTYTCPDVGGASSLIIKPFIGASANQYFLVNGNNNKLGLYNTAGGALYSLINVPGGETLFNDACDLGDNTHMFVTGRTGNVYIYNVTTNPATLVNTYNVASGTYAGTQCYGCCCNIADTSSGAPQIFVINGNYATATLVLKISYNSGYSSATVSTVVDTGTFGSGFGAYAIACNPNFGKLYICAGGLSQGSFGFSQGNWYVGYQLSNYSYTSGNFSYFSALGENFSYLPNAVQPPTGNPFFMDTTITAPTFITVNTNGFTLTSIAVSRYNPNTLYAIGSADSLLYSGTWNSTTNAVTFTRVTGITQTYTAIATQALPDPVIINASADCYTISSQSLVNKIALTGNVPSIAKNDDTEEYLMANEANNSLISYSATAFTENWSQTLTGVFNIFAKNGEDIDAGPANIYFMSVLINEINAAFATATARINQQASLSWTPPILSLDYSTGLCTLTYEEAISQTGNGILFNNALLNLINFPSSVDTISGLNILTLPLNSTSDEQTGKSIYLFNELDKILFVSNTISVTGAYFGINQSTNTITDIDVPTDTFVENVGQVLYYQPNFLRPYFMQTNLPLTRVQLNIEYSYVDFSQYQLLIPPGQNFTTKLQFIRKF